MNEAWTKLIADFEAELDQVERIDRAALRRVETRVAELIGNGRPVSRELVEERDRLRAVTGHMYDPINRAFR